MDRIEAGLIEIHQQAKTAKEKDGMFWWILNTTASMLSFVFYVSRSL
jgi:hypothetical protein